MKIDLKKPKYVIPILLLPLLFFLFWNFGKYFKPQEENALTTGKETEGLQANIQDVSKNLLKESFETKLAAYLKLGNKAEGSTEIQNFPTEEELAAQQLVIEQEAAELEKESAKNLKLPTQSRNRQPNSKPVESVEERRLTAALAKLDAQGRQESYKEISPVDIYRKQMLLMDSLSKVNDPDYKAEQKRLRVKQERDDLAKQQEANKLVVRKASSSSSAFHTLKKEEHGTFIKAIIDENVKGYAGSRLRIRLLEDITVGKHLVKKGNYLYAQITGFSAQRVLFSITSILQGDRIFTMKLNLYDNDGLQGLYVPASAFREFSKELGVNSSSGISINSSGDSGTELAMGVLQRMFQTSSTALARLIRQNKAGIKFGTQVYLIDPDQLKKDSKQQK